LHLITQFSMECLNMETYREKPLLLEAAHFLILLLYNANSDFRLQFLPPPSQGRGLLDIQFGRRKFLSKQTQNPEEIEARKKHVLFLQIIVGKFLNDFTKPDVIDRAITLLIQSAIESVALPLEVLKTVLANIDAISADPSDSSSGRSTFTNVPPVVFEIAKNVLISSNMGDFLIELFTQRYRDFATDKGILLSFFRKYQGKVSESGIDVSRYILEYFARELHSILGRVQEEKFDNVANDINSIISALMPLIKSPEVTASISNSLKDINETFKRTLPTPSVVSSLTNSVGQLIKLLSSS